MIGWPPKKDDEVEDDSHAGQDPADNAFKKVSHAQILFR